MSDLELVRIVAEKFPRPRPRRLVRKVIEGRLIGGQSYEVVARRARVAPEHAQSIARTALRAMHQCTDYKNPYPIIDDNEVNSPQRLPYAEDRQLFEEVWSRQPGSTADN